MSSDGTAPHVFQVNLSGIIDLLSNHLYSGPQVFVRELLQNAVDAIRAHRQWRRDAGAPADGIGQIRLERVAGGESSASPTLVVEDDGIGLTPDEVHAFLSTIGQSSKSEHLSAARGDFIGQFGIGLLSCFLVSDEIVLVTRSARGGPALQWRGRYDGTYTLDTLRADLQPGTKVYLRCRAGSESYFDAEPLADLARHYGGLLPFPVRFVDSEQPQAERLLNGRRPPWETTFDTNDAQREAYLSFGEEMLPHRRFFDVVPLHVPEVGLYGAAYVLPHASTAARRRQHRIYLRNMLVAEEADNLLPDWAFFATCIVDARDLRPTASREGFYEDDDLARTRVALGKALRGYLVRLAERQPERLREFVALHHNAIGALVLEDDEAFRIFADWLPVETSLGRMSLGEYRAQTDTVRYVAGHDQFRIISSLAAARNLAVIDAGYTYVREILERLPDLAPGTHVEEVDTASLTRAFDEVDEDIRQDCRRLLDIAASELAPFHCDAAVKRFEPAEIPALFSLDAHGAFRRNIDRTREVSDSLWSGLLADLAGSDADDAAEGWRRDAVLCFNGANALIQRLVAVEDEGVLRTTVRVLYVQALLLGHYPLQSAELALLSDGLSDMLGHTLDARGA